VGTAETGLSDPWVGSHRGASYGVPGDLWSSTLEQSILGLRDRAQDRILKLSHDLHQNPEIAWEEHESAARVAGESDDAGFTVESNYVGLATRFAPAVVAGRCIWPCAPNTTRCPVLGMHADTMS
jgi:hypothetical protein